MMKHLCIVLIVSWLAVSVAHGHTLTRQSPLHANANNTGNIQVMSCSSNTTVCLNGFELLSSQKCYFFSCLAGTWGDALDTCQRMGATLAYPLNQDEETVLTNYIVSKLRGSDRWWLGASYTASDGQWVWAYDNSPLVYTDWAPGQPDNVGGENCLDYREQFDWKWNDGICDEYSKFICQQV